MQQDTADSTTQATPTVVSQNQSVDTAQSSPATPPAGTQHAGFGIVPTKFEADKLDAHLRANVPALENFWGLMCSGKGDGLITGIAVIDSTTGKSMQITPELYGTLQAAIHSHLGNS